MYDGVDFGVSTVYCGSRDTRTAYAFKKKIEKRMVFRRLFTHIFLGPQKWKNCNKIIQNRLLAKLQKCSNIERTQYISNGMV